MTFLRRRQRNALLRQQRQQPAIAAHDDEVRTALAEAVETIAAAGDVECPKCGRAMKKRGAHFHIRACKGAD